ncbi:DASH complex subunit Dad3 domain-containing protein [Trichoderma sp. SZMC 28015]
MEQQQHGSLLSPPELSPLEQEVLEEYERLSTNMKTLATLLDNLASNPTVGILDGLRELERKTSLAFTLLKASVYSIVLQQEIDWGAGGEEQGGEEEAKEEETKVEEDDEEEEERL